MNVAPELGYAFFGVGIFGFAVVFLLARRPVRLLLAGGTAEGTVTGNNEQAHSGSKGPTRLYYFPIIEYATAKGETISFISRGGGRNPTPIGTQFPLIYDPAEPRDVLVRAFWNLWMFPLLTAVFTAPFLAIGLIGLAQRT